MSKTLVATFRSIEKAQNAKRELLGQGFTDQDVRIVSNDQSAAASSGYGSTSSTQESGIVGSIKHFFSSLTDADENDSDYYNQGIASGGVLLSVTSSDERVESTRALLEQYGASEFERGTVDATRTRGASAGTAARGDVAIPVVEEELQVGKREVSRGGVRVYSHVTERPVEENVQLREEHVHVQRNPVNRPASEADFQAFREGTIELTETAEEPIVSKQARVVEEVVVGKDVTERTQTVRDTVRRTDVEVEEVDTEQGRRTTTPGR
ncbi:MAG: YsnF/AvaK domain-containing protein [Bryobacteraceae bacterium]